MARYYAHFNREPGPNWYIFDRETGKKVFEDNEKQKAYDETSRLNAEDRKAKGIVIDEIETPSTYYGIRSSTDWAIAPMLRHR